MGLSLDLSSGLDQVSVLALLGMGFAAALLHAALPTHWLPFVAVGRAQGWRAGSTAAVAALAALVHIGSTALVGSAITAVGAAVPAVLRLMPYAAATVLAGLGLWYLFRPGRSAVGLGAQAVARTGGSADAAAVWGLLVLMALSPGEALLPVYVGAGVHGWDVVAWLTVAFAAGTVVGMSALSFLGALGVERFRLQALWRYERAILGLALIGLAVFVAIHPV